MADEERTGRRDVLLVGYLTREPHSQALAVDLPRWERGAVRYLLTGDKSRSLGRRVPANKKSPNRQVLEGARRPATTAREVLGGGGAPRSDVRFSPTIVAVRGSARVLSVVHWDAAEDAPARRRKQSVTDPRLPYGGVLYALDVTDVVGVFEHDG